VEGKFFVGFWVLRSCVETDKKEGGSAYESKETVGVVREGGKLRERE